MELESLIEKCYRCGKPCSGKYVLPVLESPKDECPPRAPFCKECFNELTN